MAVLEAPLHYMVLENDKILGLGEHMDFENTLFLSECSKNELKWWISNISTKNGKLIRPNKVQYYCRTDASLLGWGCCDQQSKRVS